MVMASARKKLPVTPLTEMSGRNTTTGVMVEPMSGTVISLSALRTALGAGFAIVAMHDDVLDDDDGVVDDEADSCGEPTECHQVEALSNGPEDKDGYGNRYGNDKSGDE